MKGRWEDEKENGRREVEAVRLEERERLGR